jgi:solute carrier family 25 protein 39/40
MSNHWDRDSLSDNEIATKIEKQRFGGQGHDRIHGDNPVPGVSATVAMSGDNEDVDVDITAGQKMISAMSGSLLTSLLGRFLSQF